MKVDLEQGALTNFLTTGNEITRKAMARSSPGFRLVTEVDELIRSIWDSDVQLDPVPGLLALNSYYTFHAAVRVALSGQSMATFPLIRHSIECACYAYTIARNPRLASVWLNRHAGSDEMKACRREFTSAVKQVTDDIRLRQEQLGNLVEALYQASIDFGAHPNAKSIFLPLSVVDLDLGTKVSLACLYSETDIRFQQGLVACAEGGIVAAFVTALAAKDHPLVDEQFTALEAIYGRVHATVEELQGPT